MKRESFVAEQLSGSSNVVRELSANSTSGFGQAGRPKVASTLIMLLLTVAMLSLLFPPFYCFFLAPVALAPFCICILRRPMRAKYLALYYLMALAFFMPNLFWLARVDVFGMIVLSLYLGCYLPLFAWGLHRLIVHLRLPATVAVPVVWTAVEFIRASFLHGGFPWFILGNCLAPSALLIQTADLFGVWGLTFLIAMFNGFLVDLLRLPLRHGGRFNPVITRLAILVGTVATFEIGYGLFRLHQQTTTPGPRVAVIQADFPQSIKDDPRSATTVFLTHLDLVKAAARKMPRPQLIAWPETMIPYPINAEMLAATPAALREVDQGGDWAQGTQEIASNAKRILQEVTDTYDMPQLIGYGSLSPKGSLNDSMKQNRTGLMLPTVGIVREYAKVHLVPFGEYIPFKTLPLIGPLMLHLSPYPGVDYSNTPGGEWTRFELPANAAGKTYTFGTPICFEDVMPYPARYMSAPQFGGGKKTDFLVNVSNDGWFHWVELDQHLQACQLRAVENRIAIARSVNTGNSGFIDSNGRIMGLVEARGTSIGAVGTLAMDVPIDSRVTLFSKIGDLLPIVCGIVTTLLAGWTLVRPRRGARPAEPAVD